MKVLFASLLFAVSSIAWSDDIGSTTNPLIGGFQTTARPEVGVFSSPIGNCTATLIGKFHILTAAHCRSYLPYHFNTGDFTIRKPFETIERRVIRWFGQGIKLGTHDWAVGILDRPITTVAPARISDRQPIVGETLTAVGYGCNDRKNPSQPLVKRYLEYVHSGKTNYGCPGDSGGPVFLDDFFSNGDIIRVISAIRSGATQEYDISADAVLYRDHIKSYVSAFPANGVCYRTHLASKGWQPVSCNGNISGSTGESRAIEAIQVFSDKYEICYEAHVQSDGWQSKVCDGNTAGTIGQGKRLEGLRIYLTPKYSKLFDYSSGMGIAKPNFREILNQVRRDAATATLSYSSHVQNDGWQPVVYDGELTGTVGEYKRMEAISINVQ